MERSCQTPGWVFYQLNLSGNSKSYSEGEMAQHLRAFVAHAKDLGSIPSTHTTAYNQL